MFHKTQSLIANRQSLVKNGECRRAVSRQRLAVSVQPQGGWLMPVAAFIIVVMGLLVAGLSQVGSGTAVAGAQEQISVQTLYVAESGAQWGMNRLFYDTATPISRGTADAACAAISGNTLNLSAPGMVNCSTTVTCQVQVDGGNTTSFYQITSAASCGAAPTSAQRTVQVAAYLQ